MGRKAFILLLYGVALYWILREYYRDPTNLGMPRPKTIAAPTFLYAILSLASDFTGGFTVPLAAGLTVSLIWQTNAKRQQAGVTKTGYAGPSPQYTTRFTNNDPGMHVLPPTPAQTKAQASAIKSAFNQR